MDVKAFGNDTRDLSAIPNIRDGIVYALDKERISVSDIISALYIDESAARSLIHELVQVRVLSPVQFQGKYKVRVHTLDELPVNAATLVDPTFTPADKEKPPTKRPPYQHYTSQENLDLFTAHRKKGLGELPNIMLYVFNHKFVSEETVARRFKLGDNIQVVMDILVDVGIISRRIIDGCREVIPNSYEDLGFEVVTFMTVYARIHEYRIKNAFPMGQYCSKGPYKRHTRLYSHLV